MTATLVEDPPRVRTDQQPPSTGTWVWWTRHVVVVGLFLAFSLNTDPGKLVNDTKLDLALRPLALLGRAMHLWDPLGSAGQLQNQAYGYLFPMGPFFAAADGLGVPAWVTQRLWWTMVLAVAYVGFVLLAGRLGLGTPWTRLVAGVGFALAPHVITVLGRSSVEAWPPALAPWVLLPLVTLGASGRPRRAAALSGLAVLAMGGVNAAVDLAAILPAALWLLTRQWSRQRLWLALWWVLAVLAATLWWVVPLLTLGRFSPPFLDFIESASFTTSTTTLVETLRGTADWVAYLGTDVSRAGHALLTQPVLIVMTVLIVVLGLVGLTSRRTSERAWLVLLLAVGVTLVTMGHIGPVDGFLAADLRSLLDGVLAPLRNVHKFDILIRLSLFLGLASALELLSEGASAAQSRFLGRVVAVAGAFVVVGASSPFFGLAASPTGAYEGVPGYWSDAVAWVDGQDGGGRTLLLPGSRFAAYEWGTAGDEPIQALSSSPWDVRNAVPLSSAGHIRWLDGVERAVADGAAEGLARTLAAGGVRHLIVRNDLAYGPARSTRPVVVRSTLDRAPGVDLVASFGPLVGGGDRPGLLVDHRLRLPVRALDVYRVSGDAEPRVRLVDRSDVSVVSGGPEVAGVEGGSPGASVLVDATAATSVDDPALGPRVLTDTPRRRETNFGIGTFGSSQTLGVDDPLRIAKPVRDYGAVDGAEATARYLGVRSITASSSAADADAYPRTDPGAMPFAAFDGMEETGWRPNPVHEATGSWVEVDFGREVSVGGGRVLLDAGTSVRMLGVDTDRGPTSVPVIDDMAQLPEATTRRLRLTFDEVEGDRSAALAASVRSVQVPGVEVRREVVLPPSPWAAPPDVVSLSADTGRGACVALGGRPLCTPALARTGEDAAGLRRTFSSPRRFAATLTADAVPRPGDPALERRVLEALALPVEVSASSRAVDDLGAAPFTTVDGDLGTAWVAAASDEDPALTLRWDGKRTLSDVSVLLDQYVAASPASAVRITSPDGEREVTLDASGHGTFEPLRTDEVTVHLAVGVPVRSVDAYDLGTTTLGVGVSELVLRPVTGDLGTGADAAATAVTLSCSEGPSLRVGSELVRTRVTTTAGALLAGDRLPVTPCGDGVVRVGAPETTVQQEAAADASMSVAAVRLRRVGTDIPTPTGATDVSVEAWDETHRALTVGARQEDAVLVVRENANDGWRATLDDVALTQVTVNGWQQGYVVPAGEPGTVRLDFHPDRTYRAGLLVGSLGVLVLVGLALVPERGGPRLPVLPGGATTYRAVSLAMVAALALTGGWAGLLVGVLVGLGALALRRVSVRPRWARWSSGRGLAPAVAVGAYALAGSLVLVRPFGTAGYAGNHAVTQVMVLVALAVVAVGLALTVPWVRSVPPSASGPGAPSRSPDAR